MENNHHPTETDDVSAQRRSDRWSRRAVLSAFTAGAVSWGLPAGATAAGTSTERAPDAHPEPGGARPLAETVVTGELMVDSVTAPQWAGHRIDFGRVLKHPVRVFVTVNNDDDRVRNASVHRITSTGAEVGFWQSSGSSNRLVQWLAVGADSPFLSGARVLRPRPDGSAVARDRWGARLGREDLPHVIATGVSGSDDLHNVVLHPRQTNRLHVAVAMYGTSRRTTTVQWLGVRESVAVENVVTGTARIVLEPEVFSGVEIDFGQRLPEPVRVFATAADAHGVVLNTAVSDISATTAVVGVIGSANERPRDEEISVDWVALGGTDVPYADGAPFSGDIIAHRGRNSRVPENLVGSLDGLDPWVDGVEFDARLTADGVAVVIHDATVDRTTDGTGEVAEMTLSELQALDASGERIPTVVEYLRACEGRGFARILIDMKVESEDAVRAVAEAIEASAVKDVCMILSSAARRQEGPDGGEMLRKVSSTIRLGSLGGNIDNLDDVLAWSDRYDAGLILLMPNAYLTHRSTVPVIEAAGVEPATSTINDESSLRVARTDAVAMILTDTSDRLEDY